MGFCYIYCLSDPDTGNPFYLGSSKKKNRYPKKFVSYWNTRSRFSNDGLFNKMIELAKNNKWYTIQIIDSVNYNERVFWENHYISLFYSWGFNLLNKQRSVRFYK